MVTNQCDRRLIPYAAQQTQLQLPFVEIVFFPVLVPLVLLALLLFLLPLVLLPRAELAFLRFLFVALNVPFRQVFVLSGAEPAFLRQLRQRGAAVRGAGLASARESADRLRLGDPQAADLLLRQKAQLRLLPRGLDRRGDRNQLPEGLLRRERPAL